MIDRDLRWARRHAAWRTPDDRFRPDGYDFDVIDEASQAKPFVCEHHYAGSMPATQLTVGMFAPNAALVGVAVFSVPITEQVVPAWTGLPPREGCELGRFVLAPSVSFNGESWFLARAIRLLADAKPNVRAFVSYADPLERRSAAGDVVKRAHWGTIYQATNALHVGRSSARTLVLDRHGQVISGRALTKIRKQERGWEYAARQLVAAGAPRREFGEEPAAWVARALQQFERVRHPGNLVYVFGVTAAAMREQRARHNGGLPYPQQRAA